MEILAFQPWDGGSHRVVRESITRHARHDWSWVALEPVGPRWRLRLGALELVDRAAAVGAFDARPDLLFATSLLDGAQLRAALPRSLRSLPLVLYMHENQAAYPVSEHVTARDRERDAHLVVTNLSTLLAADLVLWNSAFNRDSFLEGLEQLLRRLPGRGGRSWRERIEQRSVIAWPPVEPIPAGVLRNPGKGGYPDGVRVAWPHRWDHDKGLDELLSLVDQHAESLDLRLVLLGERPGREPEQLKRLREIHGERIIHDGWVADRTEYLERLAGCDWVLSTARHEFFGIAVVEALMCGCLPWLPERLSYPELLPSFARGLSPKNPPRDVASTVAAIRRHLDPALAPAAVDRIETLMESIGCIQAKETERHEQ
jgi:glycosyltransferase involved in cell wall biosynthesis